MKCRGTRRRDVRDPEAGVATLELVIVLPILLFFVVVIFQVGHAVTLRQRATVATRHAVWTDAMRDEDADTERLRAWITATAVSADASSTTDQLFGKADADDANALSDLVSMLPLDFSTTVTMTTDFQSPFEMRFGEPRIVTKSTLFKDTWYTQSDNEGLWGFLKKAATGITDAIPGFN